MFSKKATITCLLILTVTLLAAINAQSQTLASARILSSEGDVEIHRPSQAKGMLTQIAYRVNDELFAGDVIRTLKGGRLVLGLADGSQAIIAEQTIIKIMDTSKSPRTIFNVLRGKTRVKIERVGGRPNPYRVNTPTTVIAVRGTLFDVLVTEKDTQVFVHEGEVAVSNLARPEVLVVLSPGQKTRVEETKPPESPSTFQPGRNDDKFKSAQPENDSARRGIQITDQSGDSDRKRKPDQSPLDITTPDQKQPGGGGKP
ncbi:MAG TPA: FecR family protein [Pyrinomonadaceae bacterium]